MSEAEMVRASWAATVGVMCCLVVLRWLPSSVSLALGAIVGFGMYQLA